jgi:hypothetical protein
MRSFSPPGPGAGRALRAAACLAAALGALCLGGSPAAGQGGEEGAPEPRLSPLDFKVFGTDQPLTGLYRFIHPTSGVTRLLEVRSAPDGEEGLVGILPDDGFQALTLAPKKAGVGYEGEVLGLLTQCGQDRVPVSDFLPLGRKVILRMEARPPQIPCPFLEKRETARLVLAPTTRPVHLRTSREIVSEQTREQIGLAGQPGGVSTPIVPGAVSIEGGTELKFLGRVRSLDGSIWLEVEALVSPAAGIEPPRGFLRADELRVDASITLERTDPSHEDSAGR